MGTQQPIESQSDRLFPRFDDLVKPAFLSIAGSISALIFAALFSGLGSSVGYSSILGLLYGNIGSVLLAYSIVALVSRVHRELWAFFIVLYSILNGILGLFFFGFYYGAAFGGYSSEILILFFVFVGPIVGFIGGILGATWRISSGQAKVGSTQPTGAGLVVSGGIILSSLSLWLVLFVGPTVVITFYAGTALVLLGLLLSGGHPNQSAIGKVVVVTALAAGIPIPIWATGATYGMFEILAALWLTGVALSVLGGVRTLQLSSAERAVDPIQTSRAMSSGLDLGRAEIFSIAGSLVPGVIIWAALVTPFSGNPISSIFLYPEFGGPGQVLFAFAIAQFSDTSHRRFWGLTLAIASVLAGIGFFATYTYPLFFVYSGLGSQNGLVYGALFIAFFVAPILCFFGGLLAFLRGRRPGRNSVRGPPVELSTGEVSEKIT